MLSQAAGRNEWTSALALRRQHKLLQKRSVVSVERRWLSRKINPAWTEEDVRLEEALQARMCKLPPSAYNLHVRFQTDTTNLPRLFKADASSAPNSKVPYVALHQRGLLGNGTPRTSDKVCKADFGTQRVSQTARWDRW